MFTVVHTHTNTLTHFWWQFIRRSVSAPLPKRRHRWRRQLYCRRTRVLHNAYYRNLERWKRGDRAVLRGVLLGVNSKGMGSGTLGTLSKLAQFVWCVRARRAGACSVHIENESERWICFALSLCFFFCVAFFFLLGVVCDQIYYIRLYDIVQ